MIAQPNIHLRITAAFLRDLDFVRSTDVANELRDSGGLDEQECSIDATFAMAKGGGAEIGPTRRGKGLKIMAIVDRHGLPLSVSTHAANHHEVRLVQLCFDFSSGNFEIGSSCRIASLALMQL